MWDPKGITGAVTWNGATLGGVWSACSVSLDYSQVAAVPFTAGPAPVAPNGPTFHRGSFNIASTADVQDTYLGVYNWTKGYAWVNGVLLGRYWETAGPQHTLYVPAVFLNPGANQVLLLELHSTGPAQTVVFVDAPDFAPPTCRPQGGPSGAGDAVVMWAPGPQFAAFQQWNVSSEVRTAAGGSISLAADNSLCLSAGPKADPSTGDPALQLASCSDVKSQRWLFDATNSALVSGDSDCADVTAHGAFNGAATEVYSCNYGDNQQWTLPASNTAGTILGYMGRVLTTCETYSARSLYRR